MPAQSRSRAGSGSRTQPETDFPSCAASSWAFAQASIAERWTSSQSPAGNVVDAPHSPQVAFLSGIGTVSRDESILPGFASPYQRLHQLAGREPPRDVPPHRRIIPGRGRDELLQPLMVHPSRAAIGSIDLRRPSASSPRTYSSPAARWSLRACWARIHDRGGNLRLLVAAWACHAAVWYSCVSPPRTCFRRIRCSARLVGFGGRVSA